MTIKALATAPGYTASPVASATYTVLYRYTLTLSVGTGGTITTPSSSSVMVNYGAATTIVASPGTGYSFVNWTVASGTGVTFANANSASATVTLTGGNATIKANFTIIQYSLTVTAGSNGVITTPASSPVTVSYGAATSIVASANTGYSFVNWTVVSGTESHSQTRAAQARRSP